MDQVLKTKIETIVALYNGKLTDYTLSEVFNTAYGESALYCENWHQFLIFEGRYYRRCSSADMRRLIRKLVLDYFPKQTNKVTDSWLRSVYSLLCVLFPKQVKDTDLDHQYFAFEDGLFNTDTFKREEFSPKILCFKYVGVKIADFTKEAPILMEYLSTTLVDNDGVYDDKLFALYQEMCGSLFCANKAANRAFFLYGGGSNGKSKTTELILSLFDEQYTASASLDTLSQRFGKSRLVGKLVNICSEEESQYLKHDVFKALVTGEQIDAEYKNDPTLFGYHNFAKMVFATNNFPKFSGLDYSTRRRLVIIPFNRKFEDHEKDHDLDRKLQLEKAQFVNMALIGLKRLRDNNYQYTVSETANEAMGILEDESSSVARYVREEIKVDKERKVEPIESKDVYAHYREWCETNGHKVVASSRFAREMANLEWLQDYKVRPRGTNLFYIFEPLDDLPPTIKSKQQGIVYDKD